MYSVAVWKLSTDLANAKWEKERAEVLAKVAERREDRQELANLIGAQVETKLSNINITQKTIQQKVIHEIHKEPVYRDCVTTPDGVRLIEQAIDNRGQSTANQ